jgi:hypothetical protein
MVVLTSARGKAFAATKRAASRHTLSTLQAPHAEAGASVAHLMMTTCTPVPGFCTVTPTSSGW